MTVPSTSRTVLQEIETDVHSIPIQVSYKRQVNQGQVPLERKRPRYEYTTPTHVDETPDLYNFSEQELQEFLQPMN